MTNIINCLPDRVIKLHNVTCAYCGVQFDDQLSATNEHVIGRRFVPRGCFDRQWNLILNACAKCNGEKSDLEDDISVISMLPDLSGRFAINDPRLVSEVRRKATKSRSRRTGKTVSQSHEKITLRRAFGNGEIAFDFTAPAQISEDRVFSLAKFHFKGFFYWITYHSDAKLGHSVKGDFFPLLTARRADWGNEQLRWFRQHVRNWHLRVHAIGADGFFKIFIRRHPEGHEVWAWALEWNHGMRVVGFAGDRAAVEAFAGEIPKLPLQLIHQGPNSSIRFRTEVGLPENEDDLFVPEEDGPDNHSDPSREIVL